MPLLKPSLMLGLAALALGAAAQDAAPAPRFADQLGPTRVVVVVEQVDTDTVASFQNRRYAKAFKEVLADPDDLDHVADADSGERVVESGAIMFFVSMGGGLIGGMQQAAREQAALALASAKVTTKVATLRAESGLDRAFADAVGAELAATGLHVDGPVELMPAVHGQDLDDEGDVKGWLARNHAADARPLVLVSMRQGVSLELTGAFAVGTAWLLAPQGLVAPSAKPGKAVNPAERRADYLTHHADGTLRKTPLVEAAAGETSADVRRRIASVNGRQLINQRKALFATPVPQADLLQPPKWIVDQRVAAIHAEYDADIEAQGDRDARRYLKTRRNSELEDAPRWTPSQLTEYLRDAWLAPPGDVYPKLLAEKERDLARRLAAALLPAQ